MGGILQGYFDELNAEKISKKICYYNSTHAKEYAKKLLACFSLGEDSSTPVVRLADALGIPTYQTHLDKAVHGRTIIGADKHKIPNKEVIILVNNEDSLYRQRFAVAHELGHYILDYKLSGDRSSKSQSESFSTRLPEDAEDQETIRKEYNADAFGIELLLPEQLFLEEYSRAYEDCDDPVYIVSYLSAFFKVEEYRVINRIREICR